MRDRNPAVLDAATVDAMEERARAATPGPWVGKFSVADGDFFIEQHGDEDAPAWPIESVLRKSDASFIAAARTDIPALLASHRALAAERDGLAARVEELEAGVREIAEHSGDRHTREHATRLLSASPSPERARLVEAVATDGEPKNLHDT